jgi:hypothetical protein
MMKRTLALLVFSCLMATVAFGYDSYPVDTIGVFLDTAGNRVDGNVSPYQPFPVYLLLMYPASATNGFECTVTALGSAPAFALTTTLNGVGAIDVDASPNGFMVGCAANYPVVNANCILVTWQYMLTGPGYLQFYVNKATTPSLPGDLPVVTGDGVLRRCGVSSGDVRIPCACVNIECRGLPIETSAFGAIKALYR